jgi:RHS repeat-associated protein
VTVSIYYPSSVAAHDIQAPYAGLNLYSGGSLSLADSAASSVVGTFFVDGSLSVAGELQVGSALTLNGGTVSGSGTLALSSAATATGGSTTFDGSTFRNDGQVTQSGGTSLHGAHNATIDNRGTWFLNTSACGNCSYDTGLLWTSTTGDSVAPRFLNRSSGVLKRTAGSVPPRIAFGLDNDGAVDIASSNVYLAGGAPGTVSSGTWSGTSTARALMLGSFTLGGNNTQVGSALELASGTLSVGSGDSARVGGLTVSGGSLNIAGTLSIRDSLTVATGGGQTLGGAGELDLESSATASLGVSTYLDALKLVNYGTVTQSGSTSMTARNNATIDNYGTWNLNTAPCQFCSYDTGLLWTAAGSDTTPSRFLNHSGGVLRRTSGSGTPKVSLALDNDGSVNISATSVYLTQGVSGEVSTGTWSGTATARPQMTGSFRIGGDNTQTGNLLELAGGTLRVATSDSARLGGLLLSGGSIIADGTLKIRDTLTVNAQGATLTGAGTLQLEQTAAMSLANNATIDAVTLQNDGQVTQTGATVLTGKNGATINNNGTWLLNTAPCLYCSNDLGLLWNPQTGTPPRFLNSSTGVLARTAGTLTAPKVSFAVDNDGSVQTSVSQIYFTQGAAGRKSSGTWSGSGSNQPMLVGDFALDNADNVSPSLAIGGGTTSVAAGDSARIADLRLLGGTVDVAGTLGVRDALTFSSGSVLKGTGKLRVEPTATGTLAEAIVDGGTLRNEGTLTQSGSTRVIGQNGALFDNRGTYTLNAEPCFNCSYQVGLTAGTTGAHPVFVNRGILQKTQGTATGDVRWDYAGAGQILEQSGHINIYTYTRVPFDVSELYGGSTTTGRDPGRCAAQSADPVDCATGDFFEHLTDIAVAGRGRALRATRNYSAQAAAQLGESSPNRSGLSPGWTHDYGAYLDVVPGHVTLHARTGATTTWNASADGSQFNAASAVKAKLTKATDGTYTITYIDQTKDLFDANGRLTKQLDRDGYQTTLSYTSGGRLDHVSDEAGRTLDYGYDAAGHIASITDPLGRVVRYAYNTAGDLTQVTDVAGKTWQYAYDSRHRITSMTDPRSHSTTNTYNSADQVLTQTDAAGGTFSFAYATGSTTVTDPRGNVTRDEFTNGQLTRKIRGYATSQQSTVILQRDLAGNITQRTDPNGQLTTMQYDAAGNVTQVTDPLNRVTTMTYNAANDLLSVTDPLSTTTTFSYDSAGNPTSITRPLTGTSSSATTTYAYDATKPGDLVAVTDPTGKTWTFTHDTYGNTTGTTDPTGATTTTAFNQIGWATSTVSPRGNASGADPADYRTTTVYNDRGQPTSVTDPAGANTSTSYDDAGNATSVTAPGNKTTTTTYDALDRPVSVTRPDNSVLHFAYDADGNRTSVTDALGHETLFAYDALGRQSAQTDPAGRTTTSTYDASGRQTATVDAAGRTITLQYDAASQLQGIDYSDSQTADVDYDYDALGRRTRMVDGSGTSTYAYDSLSRLTSSTDAAGRTLRYSYDLAGHLTKTTYPTDLVAATAPGQTISDPSVTSSHDDAGRVTAITDWLGHRSEFDYDRDGNLTVQRYPNQTTATITYDHADRQISRSDSGPDNSTILDLHATRNTNGQLATQTHGATPPGQTQALTYDALDQLTQAATGSDPDIQTFSYAYDLADRLTRIAGPGSDTTLVYDAANQLTQTQDTTTADVTQTFAYDALGNRTSQDPAGATTATSYGYDQANRLTSQHSPAATPGDPDIAHTYAYDGDGLRADLLWDQTGSLPLIVADNAGLYVNGPDGLPLTQLTFTGQQRYYHHDQLGSTRAITDATGAVSARYSYTPYGTPTPDASNTDSRFGYAGQYTDHATGLIYMRARWYDPATGQFLTSDPIGNASGETNLYRYAGGDPANLIDPTGLSIWGAIASLDNPVSQAIAGALNGAFLNAPAELFGFDGACVSGEAFKFGSTYISLAVPFPGGKLAKAEKLVARATEEAGAVGRSTRFVTTARGTTFDIPEGWAGREADNGRGIVYQRPGAPRNADSIRIMEPTEDYPNGYFRYYNGEGKGQPLDVNGKPGSPSATHHHEDYVGPLGGWPR